VSDDREETIRRLLPMVRTIARRIVRLVPGSDLDDVIGDGCVGLIRAVDAFDATIGPPVDQYARRVVLGAMLNGIRRLDPVSERVRRAVRIAERERLELACERGELPSYGEMERRHPGLDRARADALRGTPLSFDAPMPPGARVPVDRSGDPALIVIAANDRRRVAAAIAALPERERAVLVAHYHGHASLRALSGTMAISPQRVSQLHLAAVARVRRALAGA